HELRSYALEELAKRGFEVGKDKRVDEVLQAFRIGYAPPGWDGLTAFLRQQGVSPTAAETVGLLVPRSSGSGFYDRFRHRLMFAVMDPQGRVVAFSGRALRDLPEEQAGGGDPGAVRSALRYVSNAKSEPPPKYINSPESPIYTKGQMLFGIHQARHERAEHRLPLRRRWGGEEGGAPFTRAHPWCWPQRPGRDAARWRRSG
ncbi:MAG: primase, partial [Labilithrix sp.]|nr:primase [Labilithrix sp.]